MPSRRENALVRAAPCDGMALFCETPRQSLAVGLVAGLLAGGAGLLTGRLVAVLVTALLVGVGGELAAHEYVGDDQYRAAKRRVLAWRP